MCEKDRQTEIVFDKEGH